MQVQYVTKKVRKLIFKFYELRNVLPLKTVYFAFIESIINYGLVIFGKAGTTIMHNLEIPQKWVIKVMLFKKRRYPTDLVYSDGKLFTINQLFVKSIIRSMLKNHYYKEIIRHGLNT